MGDYTNEQRVIQDDNCYSRVMDCRGAQRFVVCRGAPVWASMQITNGTPEKPDRNEWTRRDAPFIGNAQNMNYLNV